MKTEHNRARLNLFLEKQIINIESNNLLSLEDKVHVSEIISNICNSLAALKYVTDAGDGEEWRDD